MVSLQLLHADSASPEYLFDDLVHFLIEALHREPHLGNETEAPIVHDEDVGDCFVDKVSQPSTDANLPALVALAVAVASSSTLGCEISHEQ